MSTSIVFQSNKRVPLDVLHFLSFYSCNEKKKSWNKHSIFHDFYRVIEAFIIYSFTPPSATPAIINFDKKA